MPYIKIEPPDYLNSYAINNLSCEEFGAFMRVCLLMWQADMQLHDDDIYIARQLNMDAITWAQIKQKFDRLNIIFSDGGKLINSDIKTKYHAAEAYSKEQKDRRNKRKNTPRIYKKVHDVTT